MSVTSSGSTLCRRLWIKRICHGIVFPQHSRSVSLATKQTHRMSSQINYQPPPPAPLSPPTSPPSFLTPTHTSNSVTKNSNKVANLARKSMEKALVDKAKNSDVDSVHRLLADIYRLGHTPTITTYNHIIKALAKQFNHEKRQLEAHALLDDMTRRGILPNSQTYIQLLLGYAIHTSSSSLSANTTPPNDTLQEMQLLFTKFFQCEQERHFKRTNRKVKKLVEVMAGVGQGTILPMMMMACVKANLQLDVTTWNTALAGCAKGGYMDAAERLLEMMRLSSQQQEMDPGLSVVAIPDVTSYHTVISGYLGRGGGFVDIRDMNIDRAVELFQIMMDDGLVADYRIYQDFLYAYTSPTLLKNSNQGTSTKQQGVPLDTLQRLWQAMMTTMTDGQKLDDGVLTTLLDCYLRTQGYSAVEQVYWDLRQRGYTFSRSTAICFYKAITGFARKQHLISGIAMFYDLLAYGHGANHSATSSLLRACMLRGQLDIAQQIVDVIEETLRKPVSGDHYAFMVRAYVQQGQLELAANMFDKVQQLYESSNNNNNNRQRYLESLSTSYQAMIQGYFKLDQLDMAETLFERYINIRQQQQKSYKIDSQLVDVMVEGYGLIGEMKKLDDFLGRNDVDIITNIGTRAILIQSRLQHGNVADAERDLKEGLRYDDIKYLQSSVQAVLSSMALDGNVVACEYWVDLLSSNHLMTEKCYAALLICYGQAGEMIKLKQTYDDLNKQGVTLEDGIQDKVKSLWLENKCI
ncbi:hypothetical protein BCR42DRAFT_426698 [Absidia repens]|uniref:Pentacotripeptide-repeat region of PRORP domain-containing protein n=1 Tax=Absidia repens TaxID=90262 RepID=A0A1X2I0X1_9FUNG|nr:hypothetical protein BCR42DRAFT_426698 [Absidia repens]